MNELLQLQQNISVLIKEGSTMFTRLRQAMKQLPAATSDYGKVWFNPKTQSVFFSLSDSDEGDMYKDWEEGLKVKGVKSVTGGSEATPDKSKGPWLFVKSSEVQTVLGPLAQAAGWKSIPGIYQSTPLSATIASSVLGAGAGYGLGTLAEHVLPEKYFEKGKLRKTLGIAGLGAGIPGLWAGTVNLRNNAGFMDPIGHANPPKMASVDFRFLTASFDKLIDADEVTVKYMNKYADGYDRNIDYADPSGSSFMGGGGAPGNMAIEKDRLNRPIWDDPYLQPSVKSMASGVVEGASQINDGSSFSPVDVARLGASMATNAATGWGLGWAAGKVLGGLAGLSPQGQEALQRTGTFAGLITAVIPKMFGNQGMGSDYYR